MAERTFDIIFSGGLIDGFEVNDVKTNLQALFKLDDASVAKLFAGKSIAIKKNLNRQTANQYQAALTKAGAKIQLALSSQTQAVAEKPALKKADALAEQPKSNKSNTVNQQEFASSSADLAIFPAGQSLLQEQEQSPKSSIVINVEHIEMEKPVAAVFQIDDDNQFSAAMGNDEAKYPSHDTGSSDARWDLADTGSDLSPPTDPVVASPIETDYLDIDPLGSYLSEALKQDSTLTDTIHVSSNITLCDAGTELLNEDERQAHSELDVDISRFTLADEAD